MRGAVLAGGAASRFGGRPKGLERVGGERILDRAVRVIQSVTGQLPALIANAPEASQWRPDLQALKDPMPDRGSLGGLYTAVTAGEGPVLVVAWDMPFVPASLLETLVRQAESFDAFLPESGGAGAWSRYVRSMVRPARRRFGPESISKTTGPWVSTMKSSSASWAWTT